MFRFMGIFALVPAAVLLTISFFVLFANQKVETKGLKKFGSVIAALLWAAVFLILTSGILLICTGRHPAMGMRRAMGMKHDMMNYCVKRSTATCSGKSCCPDCCCPKCIGQNAKTLTSFPHMKMENPECPKNKK